ncbi:Cilia BBSome complex subunit 10 family-containing protein [Strongyloides ratti]|uniref:Cilia BBSome complex subunit 10 family-containing protein n=1 Tax=Strongyloides ratti TaxID=34506 RepID=A0A090L6S5_STRRB|nr:Cilia BBSome complex subunit 10 family-containing protein [Strongyloides ratti]CEF65447.1 Cilia BBSome complex subunit 10 family-containing protein [Strongyloides ratti]
MDKNISEQDSFNIQITLRNGILFPGERLQPVFCKPKLIPLKSVTLEKLERMQEEALDKLEKLDKNIKEDKEESNLKGNLGKDSNEIEGMKNYSNKTDVWSADD